MPASAPISASVPPLLSVLMPVYNSEKYLAAAVQSILTQTFTDFELIVVDDGSTDTSPQILRKFAHADQRVRLISRPNTGYVVALNEALALARGQLIARMDGDDVCAPHRFAVQIDYLRANPDCVLVGSQVITMDEDGDLIGPMPDIAFGHEQIDQALINRGWPIVHPSVMMRSDALRRVGGYHAEYCPNEDHDLFLKLAEIGRIENLPQPLFYYRRHPASVSAANPQRSVELLDRIIADACHRRGTQCTNKPNSLGVRAVNPSVEKRAWAWLALKSGNIGTARKYAWTSVRSRPFSSDSWRLLYCAARGH